jgi:hypothetical protein
MMPAGYVAAMRSFIDGSDKHPNNSLHPVVNGHVVMLHDSVVVVADSMTRDWLHALQRIPLAPRSFLNMAAMHAEVGQDVEAQQRVTAWLASPGITQHDSALAFRHAVAFFLDTHGAPPETRLAIARGYIARLEALPVTLAAVSLFAARNDIMVAYSRVGAADSAIAAGLRAIATIPHMPTYESRAWAAASSSSELLARLLAGQPGGLARIDALLATLQHVLVVPPAVLSQDTALIRLQAIVQEEFDGHARLIRYFGRPAAPLVATHWFNQATPSVTSDTAPRARVLPLDDGTIRIIAFGDFGCPACRATMRQLQHDQTVVPRGVQFLFYESTQGSWDGRFCAPDDEAEHIRQYWLGRKRYTFPIAVWAGPKDSTSGGGILPRLSPTVTAMQISAYPTFFIIDGHGIVRHWQEGYDTYNDISGVVDQLVRERDHTAFRSSTH